MLVKVKVRSPTELRPAFEVRPNIASSHTGVFGILISCQICFQPGSVLIQCHFQTCATSATTPCRAIFALSSSFGSSVSLSIAAIVFFNLFLGGEQLCRVSISPIFGQNTLCGCFLLRFSRPLSACLCFRLSATCYPPHPTPVHFYCLSPLIATISVCYSILAFVHRPHSQHHDQAVRLSWLKSSSQNLEK
jgi:hypothetical protein